MKIETLIKILAAILLLLVIFLVILTIQNPHGNFKPDETDAPVQTTIENDSADDTHAVETTVALPVADPEVETTGAEAASTIAPSANGDAQESENTPPVVPTADPDQYAEDETMGEDDVPVTIPASNGDSEEPVETTEDSNMLDDEEF